MKRTGYAVILVGIVALWSAFPEFTQNIFALLGSIFMYVGIIMAIEGQRRETQWKMSEKIEEKMRTLS